MIADTNAEREMLVPLPLIISNAVGENAFVPLALNVMVQLPPGATEAQGSEVCITFSGNWLEFTCTLVAVVVVRLFTVILPDPAPLVRGITP